MAMKLACDRHLKPEWLSSGMVGLHYRDDNVQIAEFGFISRSMFVLGINLPYASFLNSPELPKTRTIVCIPGKLELRQQALYAAAPEGWSIQRAKEVAESIVGQVKVAISEKVDLMESLCFGYPHNSLAANLEAEGYTVLDGADIESTYS